MVKLAVLLPVIFDVHGLLPVSQILLCHLTACVLPKRTLKHPLNKMALQQQFGGRVKGAYQSLNCCLTALQHKTHLIEKMADKPCEILRPRGEHRSTLLLGGDLYLKICLSVAAALQFFSHVVCFNIVFFPRFNFLC